MASTASSYSTRHGGKGSPARAAAPPTLRRKADEESVTTGRPWDAARSRKRSAGSCSPCSRLQKTYAILTGRRPPSIASHAAVSSACDPAPRPLENQPMFIRALTPYPLSQYWARGTERRSGSSRQIGAGFGPARREGSVGLRHCGTEVRHTSKRGGALIGPRRRPCALCRRGQRHRVQLRAS